MSLSKGLPQPVGPVASHYLGHLFSLHLPDDPHSLELLARLCSELGCLQFGWVYFLKEGLRYPDGLMRVRGKLLDGLHFIGLVLQWPPQLARHLPEMPIRLLEFFCEALHAELNPLIEHFELALSSCDFLHV